MMIRILKKRSTLSASTKNSIKRCIDHGFHDWIGYQQYLAGRIDAILDESQNFGIDAFLLKLSMKRYLKTAAPLTTKEEKQSMEEARTALTAIYVMILYHHEEIKTLRWSTADELLAAYPMFNTQSTEELQLLLQYRNIVRITLQLMPAARNKKTIMAVGGRLQGKPKDYITGGGQKEDTKRRVLIYEHEGGVLAQRRPDRQLAFEGSINCDTSTVSSLSVTPRSDEAPENEFQSKSPLMISTTDSTNNSFDNLGSSTRSDASTVCFFSESHLSSLPASFNLHDSLHSRGGSFCSYDSSSSPVEPDDELDELLRSFSSEDNTAVTRWEKHDCDMMVEDTDGDDSTSAMDHVTFSATKTAATVYMDEEFKQLAAVGGSSDESLAFSNRNSLRLLQQSLANCANGGESLAQPKEVMDYNYDASNGQRNSPTSSSVSTLDFGGDNGRYVDSTNDTRSKRILTAEEQSTKRLKLAVDPHMFDNDIPEYYPRHRELLKL